MNTILIFLYLFDFNIIKGVAYTSSVFVVLLFLLLGVATNSQINKSIGKMLGGNYNRMIIKFMMVLILLSIIVPTIQFTYDYTYAITLIHQLFSLEIGIMLVGYFKYKKCNIIDNIIDAFFIQSVIQLLCLFSPTILKITDIFRETDTIIRRERSYVGFRGLAISGSAFFGLAVAYAFLFLILAFYWNKWEKSNLKKIIYLVCMLFGALSAGRTSIIGIIIFVIYYFFGRVKDIDKSSMLRGIIIIVLICLVLFPAYKLYLANYLERQPAWIRFSQYVEQIFGNDSSNSKNRFSLSNVSSLNNLFTNMYFKPSLWQVFLGDARYTENGLYYLHTDVGYLRNILFWGIGGTILLYAFYICMILKNVYSRQAKNMAMILIFIGFVFEAKGQTMGFLIISQSVLILLCNSFDFLENDRVII